MTESRRRWLIVGVLAVLGCAALGSVILNTRDNRPLALDTLWMQFLRLHHNPVALSLSTFLGDIGGGVIGGAVIPILLVAVFLTVRRPWTAAYFGVTTIVSAESVVLLKILFDRPRPGHIVIGDIVGSFPSGHAANAATMVVILCLTLRRSWLPVLGISYVVAMMASRTYLAVHWLSDTVGGAAVGAGVALILYSLVSPRLERERTGQPAPGQRADREPAPMRD